MQAMQTLADGKPRVAPSEEPLDSRPDPKSMQLVDKGNEKLILVPSHTVITVRCPRRFVFRANKHVSRELAPAHHLPDIAHSERAQSVLSITTKVESGGRWWGRSSKPNSRRIHATVVSK